jgi:hypothetical protein
MGHLGQFSRRWFALSALAGLPILASPVRARTFVLKADGTGDAPTFQAGLDSIAAHPDFRDTLIVEPGSYDEDIVPTGGHFVVMCPGGADSTSVRSLHSFYHPGSFVGLTIQDSTVVQENGGTIFTASRFHGPVDLYSFLNPYGGFNRCTFDSRAYLRGSLLTATDCSLHGTLILAPDEDPELLYRCSFSGQDTAVTAVRAFISRCTFTNVGRAIAGTQGANRIGVDSCAFSYVSGPAIDLAPPPQGYSLVLKLTVHASCFVDIGGPAIQYEDAPDSRNAIIDIFNSRMERCEAGLKVAARNIGLRMFDDTLLQCRRTAIGADASIASAGAVLCEMAGVVVDGSGGMAADLRGVGAALLHGCTFTRNKAGGVSTTVEGSEGLLPWLPPDSLVGLTCRQNTVALNGGVGLTVAQDQGNEPATIPVTIDGNIFAGNMAGGLVTSLPYAAALRHNDAWANVGEAFTGLVASDGNLALDPQFCDGSAGDFRVASSSPCAPTGPYGQIGALGVGCDAMTVPVDVQSQPINVRSNASVEAAILGTRLFDPHRVDPATVRLSGAAPSPRGSGRTSTQLKDVNQDGFADLLLAFDSRDLSVEGGEATLEARTFDGVSFRGSDAVQIVGTAPRASLERASDIPTRLALAIPPTHGELSLLVDLPRAEPASLDVFDIAGRRVASRDLSALGPGHHRIQLDAHLSAGLYLLRLRQADVAVVARALVLH